MTLTVWHGWTDEREASAFQAMLDRFHLLHPNIGVRAVGGVTDSQIINGIRSEQNVDVVSSFTTDDVGLYCGSGAWVDLNPFLRSSGIDAAKTFTAPSLAYSAYHGDQCALPLLGDTFGLYYNKAMFAKAGIERPPRTLSELEADAAKLTVRAADGSLRVAGFLPDVDWYENAPDHLQSVFGIRFQDADNRSVLAGDPGVASELRFQSRMMAVLGGADEAQAFAAGPAAGDENSAANAFLTGKVAMAVGGEWTTAEIAADAPDLDYGTAPLPVADDRVAAYGSGTVTGTVIGIARTTRHSDAAWELVRFLTTDTGALTAFANAIHNVPTTYAVAADPALAADDRFRTFIAIAADPRSTSTPPSPNGGYYKSSFQRFVAAYEAGRVTDPQSALRALDREIDSATDQGREPTP
ncbi:extracellular solute-binding protein [Catenulispora yoronensis]|uniref:extracellular solute-binding protein n=1 Tax=Catenulispora yoronensis TaxID=450799 RepID=UPI0031E2E337